MNGSFVTRNLNVAAYLLTIGMPYPTLTPDGQNYVTFKFDDPRGECIAADRELDLGDTDSDDKCCLPAARIFRALQMLKTDLYNKKRGL
jgi:hypothetical protein